MGASEGSQPGATRQAGLLLAARAISRSSRDPSSWELSLRVGVIQTGAFPRQSYRSFSRSREHGVVQGTAASARHHRVPDPPIWVYTPFCRFNRCTLPAPSPWCGPEPLHGVGRAAAGPVPDLGLTSCDLGPRKAPNAKPGGAPPHTTPPHPPGDPGNRGGPTGASYALHAGPTVAPQS